MSKRKILISKDVFMKSYLPVYGNKYNQTPNINELAAKGTVFNNHYTAAPSTAMSFTSMFTGIYAYETDRQKYTEVSDYEGVTLFDQLYDQGYNCHVIWDKRYVKLAQKFSKCYGKSTKIHNCILTKDCKTHTKGVFDEIVYDESQQNEAVKTFHDLLDEITSSEENVFVWVHFPHTISGTNVWGSDMSVFDRMVGEARSFFSDDNIYITADHGHMNGEHGKYGYGFDLNEAAISIPLITPRLAIGERVDFPTSNTQLSDIILNGNVEQRDHIFSETAYYVQPHRKLAVISGRYKYIYEKKTKKEFLYDIEWDPMETTSLINPDVYDVDRRAYYPSNQRWFYPYWSQTEEAYNKLREIKKSIWKDADFVTNIKERLLFEAKIIYSKFSNWIRR